MLLIASLPYLNPFPNPLAVLSAKDDAVNLPAASLLTPPPMPPYPALKLFPIFPAMRDALLNPAAALGVKPIAVLSIGLVGIKSCAFLTLVFDSCRFVASAIATGFA